MESKYEALSYTWGEQTFYNGFTYKWNNGPTPTFPIEMNSSGFLRVTKNLHEFLEYLADEAPFGDSVRRIWADRVCINQKGIGEGSKRVVMMRNIYVKAWETFIWLGKQDYDMLIVSDIVQGMMTPPFDYFQKSVEACFEN